MSEHKEVIQEAAEAAAEAAKTILEAGGIRYAGVAVVAELPQPDENTIQTGCWVCVRDKTMLQAVKTTLVQAVERMSEDATPDAEPEEPN